MQAANTGELPKRSRYYQGVIDMDIINKGQLYNTLKASYVIFICKFDLFGAGLYKYTFENLCREDSSIVLGDETQKIFLNAKTILDDLDVDEDLKAFLAYVDGKESSNEFVQELQSELEKVKSNENWRRDYMMQHINDQLKIEEGKEIGELSKLISQIKKIQKSKSLDIIDIADILDVDTFFVTKVQELLLELRMETNEELAYRVLEWRREYLGVEDRK